MVSPMCTWKLISFCAASFVKTDLVHAEEMKDCLES